MCGIWQHDASAYIGCAVRLGAFPGRELSGELHLGCSHMLFLLVSTGSAASPLLVAIKALCETQAVGDSLLPIVADELNCKASTVTIVDAH